MPLLICHRLLLLLLLWVAASHGDSSDDGAYDPSMCLNQNYTCGSVNITYPFYLKGNADLYCGYPGLGILCEDDDKPILQLDGAANYTVTSFDGALATLYLADPEVDDGKPCPRPRINTNVTLQQESLLYFPDSTVDYLIFFIDCTFNSTSHQPSYIRPISCESFDDGPGPGLSFVLPDDAVPAGNWVQACNQVIQLPVHNYGEINLTDPGWTNGSRYASVLRQKFQLGWNESAKPPACTQCEGSNSRARCGYSRTGDFIGCLCPDGRVHSDNNCNEARKFSEPESVSLQKLRFSSWCVAVL